MIVDADHGLQIGRINAAHDIVIARQLWIISIHHTLIIALRQREYFDAEGQKREMLQIRGYKCARIHKSEANKRPYLVANTNGGFPH